MTNNTLKKYAHSLRLSGLLSTLDLRLKEAETSRLPYHQFLEMVFQDELNVREQRTIARRQKAADFREIRSLDNFDFAFSTRVFFPEYSSALTKTGLLLARQRTIAPMPKTDT